MPADMFVYWKKGHNGPTRAEAKKVIEDYYGEVLVECKWSRSRFFVPLVGTWSHPQMRVAKGEVRKKLRAQRPREAEWQGRFLEVYLGKDALDVMTRQQDRFTSVCAQGLAKEFASWWDGRVDAE